MIYIQSKKRDKRANEPHAYDCFLHRTFLINIKIVQTRYIHMHGLFRDFNHLRTTLQCVWTNLLKLHVNWHGRFYAINGGRISVVFALIASLCDRSAISRIRMSIRWVAVLCLALLWCLDFGFVFRFFVCADLDMDNLQRASHNRFTSIRPDVPIS